MELILIATSIVLWLVFLCIYLYLSKTELKEVRRAVFRMSFLILFCLILIRAIPEPLKNASVVVFIILLPIQIAGLMKRIEVIKLKHKENIEDN